MSRGDGAARVQREDLVVEPLEAPLPFLTICGSKLPLRSHGVRMSTGPWRPPEPDRQRDDRPRATHIAAVDSASSSTSTTRAAG